MIGVDIVEHERIDLKIAKKVLAKSEIKVLEDIKRDDMKVSYIASRFAVKEAIIKASNKKLLLKDIETIKTDSGKVEIKNHPEIEISLAHEKKYSVAVALIKESK